MPGQVKEELLNALKKLCGKLPTDSEKLQELEQWALWEDSRPASEDQAESEVEKEVNKLLSQFEPDERKVHDISRFAFDGALQMSHAQNSKQTDDAIKNYIRMGALSTEQKKFAIKNQTCSKICLPPANENSYAVCRRVFLLQAINLIGSPTIAASTIDEQEVVDSNANNDPLTTITRILQQTEVSNKDCRLLMLAFYHKPDLLNPQGVIQQIQRCLERDTQESKNLIRNGQDPAANNKYSVSLCMVRALVQAYMSYIYLKNEEQTSFDVLEQVLIQTFKTMAQEFTELVKLASDTITTNNQDQISSVFKSQGSIVNILLFLSFCLCQEDMLGDKLDEVPQSLIDCAKSLQNLETKLKSNQLNESEFATSISTIQDKIQYVIGAVSYRLISHAPRKNQESESKILQQLSQAGRVLDTKNFSCNRVSENVNRVINNFKNHVKDQQVCQSYMDDIKQSLVAPNNDFIDMIDGIGEYNDVLERILSECRQNARQTDFFVRPQDYQNMNHNSVITMFAFMVKYQGKMQQMNKLRQNIDDPCLTDLKNIMIQAGNMTCKLIQDIKAENNDEHTVNNKKQDLIEKAKYFIKQNLTNVNSTELYQDAMKILQNSKCTFEDLTHSLEDQPFQSALKRAIGFNILKEAIKYCPPETKQHRIMTILTWFQRAMRYQDVQNANYLSGLPTMTENITASIRKQFSLLIEALLGKLCMIDTTDKDSELLCSHLIYGFSWAYKEEDFEWLADLNIFGSLLAGNNAIRQSLGSESCPTKFHQALKLGELPLASCILQVINQIACSLLASIVNEQDNCSGRSSDPLADVKQQFGENDRELVKRKQLFGELCAFLNCNLERYLDVIQGQNEQILGNGEKFPSLVRVVCKVGQKLTLQVEEEQKEEYIPKPQKKKPIADDQDWECQSCEWQNPASSRLCEFCQVYKPLKTSSDLEEVTNQEYTEVAIWGVLGTLELLVDLTQNVSFQNQLVDPNYVSLILRITLEASPQNQIMAHRVLQNMLKSPLVTEDILEEAVRIASKFDGPVFDILHSKTDFRFQNSQFLKIIFHQVMISKQYIYRYQFDKTARVNCVTQEALRTVKSILEIGGNKFHSMINSLKVFVTDNLKNIKQLSIEKMDAVFSLVPEMAPQKVTSGSHCYDIDDEKRMILLGHYRNKATLHFKAVNTDYSDIMAIDQSDEKANVLVRELGKMRSLIDVNPKVEEKLVTNSLVYYNIELMKHLVAINLKEEDYDKNLLFVTSFYRGLNKIISIKGSSYLDFLQQHDLLRPLIEKLIEQAGKKLNKQNSIDRLEHSTDHLEQFADLLRERSIVDKTGTSCLVNRSKTQILMAGQAFSVKDSKRKFFVFDHDGNVKIFEYEEDYGQKKGLPFHGKIADRPDYTPVDNLKKDDQIFVIESQKLKNPSEQTYRMLKYSKIIITDSSVGLVETVKKLEKRVTDNPNAFLNRAWDECFPQRYIVMRNEAAFIKLKQINQYGSSIVCTDEELENEHLEEMSKQLIDLSLFAHLAPTKPDKGFWETGNVAAFKSTQIKSYKPDVEFNMFEIVKKYSQARIANHRRVEEVWKMIEPTQARVEEFQAKDDKPIKYDHTSELANITLITKTEADIDASSLSTQLSDQLTPEDVKNIQKLFQKQKGEGIFHQGADEFIDQEDPEYEEVYKYRLVLNSLIVHRSRRLLLKILSLKPEICMQELIRAKEDSSYSLIFQLLHDEFTLASKYPFKKIQDEAKDLIRSVMRNSNDDIKAKFLIDLIIRGQETVNQKFKNAMNTIGSNYLNPKYLIEFSSPDFAEEVQLNNSSDISKQIALYDLMLAFAFGIQSKQSSQMLVKDKQTDKSIDPAQMQSDLLVAAKKHLDSIIIGLLSNEISQEQCEAIINNALLHKLFFSDQESQKLILTSRGHDLFQLLDSFKNLQRKTAHRFKIESNMILSKQCQKVLKYWQIIREGMNSEQLMFKTKMNLVLQDQNCIQETEKWGLIYTSDLHVFDNLRFRSVIEADQDEDKIIYIDKNQSDQTVRITREADGEQLFINARRLESLGKNNMVIPKGTRATIEISESHPSVLFSGKLRFQNDLQSQTWKQLFDSSVIQPQQVYGDSHQTLFVDQDDSLWAMGQGLFGPDDQGWLRKIPCPEDCRDFAKVLHCKNFRLVLTTSGKLFINGRSQVFQDILQVQGESDCALKEFKEVDLQGSFKELDINDKIIDVTVGSPKEGIQKKRDNNIAIVTESGKVYVVGFNIHKSLNFQLKYQSTKPNTETSFEVLPKVYNTNNKEQYKVKQAFLANNNHILWLNCEDPTNDNKLVTVAIANNDAGSISGVQYNQKEQKDNIKPIKPLEKMQNLGLYFKKICTDNFTSYGICSNNDLWIWGDSTLRNEKDVIDGEFDESVPNRVKWFSDQGLKVHDIQVGDCTAIVKTQNQNGEMALYGLPFETKETVLLDEDGEEMEAEEDEEEEDFLQSKIAKSINMIGGNDQYKEQEEGIHYKNLICKINFTQTAKQGQEILSFGCSKKCAFILLSQPSTDDAEEQKEQQSKDAPQNLLHYYRDNSGWHCMKSEEYESNKDYLPDICFATRHPLSRQDQFDQLDELQDQVDLIETFDQGSQVHDLSAIQAIKHSLRNQDEPATNPIYFSNSRINGENQMIVATENEANQGGQTWDLNPLVYYRIKKPLQAEGLYNLSEVLLGEIDAQPGIYNQNLKEIRQIQIIVRRKEVSNQDLDTAIEISSEETKRKLEQIKNFTQKQDQQILQALEVQLQLKNRFPDAQDFSLKRRNKPDNDTDDATANDQDQCLLSAEFFLAASQFEIGKSVFMAQQKYGEQSLAEFDENLVKMRAELLLKLNMIFYKLYKLVDHDQHLKTETNHGRHFALKHSILPTLLCKLIKNDLSKIEPYETNPSDKKFSVTFSHNFRVQEDQKQQQKPASSDTEEEKKTEETHQQQKSTFHQLIDKINDHMPEEPLKIFRNSNMKHQPFCVGDDVEKIIDNGGAYRALLTEIMDELKEGRNVNCFQKTVADSDVYILNDKVDEQGLHTFTFIGGLIAFSFLTRQPFSINFANAVWKQILGDKLTMEDLLVVNEAKYLELEDLYPSFDEAGNPIENEMRDYAISSYFSTYQINADYIRQGMDQVLLNHTSRLAYMPLDDLKRRICGFDTYTVEQLKSITQFHHDDNDNQEEYENHEKWFYEILEEFDQEMRRKYLIFVWGRDRLPSNIKEVEQHKFKLYIPKQDRWIRNSIPKAHTCGFQLECPYYDNKSIFRKQLIYAINNSDGIAD